MRHFGFFIKKDKSTQEKKESEEEVSEKPTYDPNLLTAKISALLDFYSDRAVAHASFLVASVFGLVTLSAMIQELSNHTLVLISLPLFLGFSYTGYFTLLRFQYYACIAHALVDHGLKEDATMSAIPLDENTLLQYRQKQSQFYEALLFPKKLFKFVDTHVRISDRKVTRIILMTIYWGVIILLSIFVYSKFWDSLSAFVSWMISFVITILLVVIPPVYDYLKS